DGRLTLRPMSESDLPFLMAINNDPEVLYYSEGDDVTSRPLEEVQAIYRHVSQTAFCFVIEVDGAPVGDCWLQQMNLERLRARFPDFDCRRVDLELVRASWGRGVGGASLRLLLDFAFEGEGADAVFGCDVADYNDRSRRLFLGQGFTLVGTNEQPAGLKAGSTFDFARFRDARQAASGSIADP
ncbi:MAG TPA: GNAT family N-acetyltransferase, partial [Caulobacteraceae bacterium]